MKRFLFVVFVLAFTLGVCTLALQAEEVGKKQHRGDSTETAGVGQRNVSDGPATISVNSFGKAEIFRYAGSNHLLEALHFVSVNNGPVQKVDDPAYTVRTPLIVTGRTSYSAVQRMPGDLFIEFYNTIVDNTEGLMDWYIEVYLYNLTDGDLPVCYYFYVDLDLFGTFADDIPTVHDRDPDLGVRSFRVTKQGRPDVLFVVADLTQRADSFEMRPYPQVQDRIAEAQNCIELTNMLRQFPPPGTGDFTGAMRYKTTIPAQGFTHADFLVSRLQ